MLSLMHAFLPKQQEAGTTTQTVADTSSNNAIEDSVDSIPAIISASVEAVESYGWQVRCPCESG